MSRPVKFLGLLPMLGLVSTFAAEPPPASEPLQPRKQRREAARDKRKAAKKAGRS